MEQKIEIFRTDNVIDLKAVVNEFAKTHHIEQMKYQMIPGSIYPYHCCVLYTDKRKVL